MRRKASALVCLALALLLAGGCLAAPVARPANGCVADMAGVLRGETVDHIVARNQALTDTTGAVIAVVTVDFLNGRDIDDYATDLFNDWGVGDGQENNGVLILLAIGEDNYTILQGEGLQSALPTSTLGEYAGEYLDADFEAGEYDAGVNKLFDALYAWFEDYYAGTGSPAPGGGSVQPDYPGQSSGGVADTVGSLVVFTVVVVGAVLVFALIATLLSRVHYGGVYYYAPYRPWPFFFGRRRRRYGPPAPPRPPSYRPHTGGGHSRGGGYSRSSGPTRRSSGGLGGGSFRSGGRSGFGGGHSRGGGFRRR